MLKHRLLMSALLIPATIGLFVWDHHLGNSGHVLLVLLLFISARCVWELVVMARLAGFRPNLMLTKAATWSLILFGWVPIWSMFHFDWYLLNPPLEKMFLMWGVVATLLVMNSVFRYPVIRQDQSVDELKQTDIPISRGREIGTLGIELLIVTYVGVLLTVTSQLRWTGGYFALGALIVATKMGDVGAYTFGRLIGGTKMTPKLSPGKTWAGGVGHIVTAAAFSIVWLSWLGPKISMDWPSWGVLPASFFGILVGFAGLIGDLAESLIKRDVGVKDAPALLPGFGGLLDLMDSILLAGPVAYFMWHLLS